MPSMDRISVAGSRARASPSGCQRGCGAPWGLLPCAIRSRDACGAPSIPHTSSTPGSSERRAVNDRLAIPPMETPIGQARRGLDLCVHCGFCLQACPTYLALEDENDSPRGRLVLMRALVEGTLDADDPSVQTHIDRCLGCRGCETACPSGVPYGELLEATRATLARDRPLPVLARLILWVFAKRSRLAVAMAGARALRTTRIAAVLARLPGRLGFAMAMLASTAGRTPWTRGSGSAPARPTPAAAPPRGRAAILRGCVMDGLFARTNEATIRAVAKAGYEIVDVPAQGCCGALHAHAGDLAGARALARANVAAFVESGASVIVSNAAGC